MRIDAGRMTAAAFASALAVAVALGAAGAALAQTSAAAPAGSDPAWKPELEAWLKKDHGCSLSKLTFASFTSGNQEMVFATIDCSERAQMNVQRVGKTWTVTRK